MAGAGVSGETRARCELCGRSYGVDIAGIPLSRNSYDCDDCGGPLAIKRDRRAS